MKYSVTIKNISARVDKMTLPVSESVTITIDAKDEFSARQKATKHLFDGCSFVSEGSYGEDGTQIGAIAYGGQRAKKLYGRIWVSQPVPHS